MGILVSRRFQIGNRRQITALQRVVEITDVVLVVCLVAVADLRRRIGRWAQMMRVAVRGVVLEWLVMRGVVCPQGVDIGRGGAAVYLGRVRNDQHRLQG